jgi:hypothetical protein
MLHTVLISVRPYCTTLATRIVTLVYNKGRRGACFRQAPPSCPSFCQVKHTPCARIYYNEKLVFEGNTWPFPPEKPCASFAWRSPVPDSALSCYGWQRHY